ncbi:hypothetical protein B0H12DRAFT_1327972 [Mycena haematopus]|nr:hypothetical protein B0H12DRAFT_1327972 [Mycena haematopus]
MALRRFRLARKPKHMLHNFRRLASVRLLLCLVNMQSGLSRTVTLSGASIVAPVPSMMRNASPSVCESGRFTISPYSTYIPSAVLHTYGTFHHTPVNQLQWMYFDRPFARKDVLKYRHSNSLYALNPTWRSEEGNPPPLQVA